MYMPGPNQPSPRTSQPNHLLGQRFPNWGAAEQARFLKRLAGGIGQLWEIHTMAPSQRVTMYVTILKALTSPAAASPI